MSGEGVRGVSSGAPALRARACSPQALSEGTHYETARGCFGVKRDNCVGVNGALGQSDICDRLCVESFSSLL